MSFDIAFEVPGVPVPKARARSAKTASGKTIHYTPAKTANFEELVAIKAKAAFGGRKPFDGPVYLQYLILLPIPKSWSEKKRNAALRGEIMPTSTPDKSNVLKSIEDGMNGVVYKDDSQIVMSYGRKEYSLNPCCKVRVMDYRVNTGVENDR